MEAPDNGLLAAMMMHTKFLNLFYPLIKYGFENHVKQRNGTSQGSPQTFKREF